METLVETPINCQGKLDFCQGKVRKMSGNFNAAGVWEPCQSDHYLFTILCCVNVNAEKIEEASLL